MLKRIYKYTLICLACFIGFSVITTLNGCGMDGPLYLPDKDHPQQPSQPDKPSWF